MCYSEKQHGVLCIGNKFLVEVVCGFQVVLFVSSFCDTVEPNSCRT